MKLNRIFAFISLVGASMSLTGCFITGGLSMLAGYNPFFPNYLNFILDDKNPGRKDALNPLPLETKSLSKAGLSREEGEIYNHELPEILASNEKIEKLIEDRIHGRTDAQSLEAAAVEFDFKSGAEIRKLIESKKMSEEALQKFAKSQNLTPSTAKAFLSLRFGVKF